MATASSIANTLNPLKPFKISDRGEFKISFGKALTKATDSSNSAPKSKHIRRIVLETHQQHNGVFVWQELSKRKLTDKLIAWKCVNVTHRVLLEGHHSVLEEVDPQRALLRTISRNFKNENQTSSPLVTVLQSYVDYLLTKLEFHAKFAGKGSDYSQQFAGNFALEEFLRHQPPSQPPATKFQNYLQYLGLLLDLQENILNFQNLVLRESKTQEKESNVADQAVVWSLIPLIPECYGIYTIITNILKYVINQSELLGVNSSVSVSNKNFKSEDDLFDFFTSKYYSQYISLRDFFFKASNVHAIFSVIPIPTLPAEPPAFVRVQSDRNQVKRSKERRRLQQSEKASSQATSIPITAPNPTANVSGSSPFQISFPPQQQQQQQPSFQAQPFNMPFTPPFNASVQPNNNNNQFQASNLGFQSSFPGSQPYQPIQPVQGLQNLQPSPFATAPTPSTGAPSGWVTFGSKPATAVVPTPQPIAPVQVPIVLTPQPIFSTPPQNMPQTATTVVDSPAATESLRARITEMENMNINLIQENAQMKQRMNDMEELLQRKLQEDAAVREELDKVRAELVSVRNEVDEERRRRLTSEIEVGVAGIEASLLGLDQLEPGNTGNSSDPSRLLRASRGLVENLRRLLETKGFTRSTSEEEKESYIKQVLRRTVEQTVEMMHCTKEVGDETVARAMRGEGEVLIGMLEKIGRTIDNEDDWAKAIGEIMASGYGQNLMNSLQSNVSSAVASLSERQIAESDKRLLHQQEQEQQQKLSEEEKIRLAKEQAVEKQRQLEASGAALESKASQELMNAARIIEEASKRLIEERNKLRAKEEANNNNNNNSNNGTISIEGTIMDGAGGITLAVGLLIQAATEAQKEREAEGRGIGNEAMYKEDVAWMEGLISAAKQVAVGTFQLVEAAQNVGSGPGGLDTGKLVAASKGVAAAVALLVSAFKAKAKLNSKCNDKLIESAAAVRKATNGLVESARAAGDQEYEKKKNQENSARRGNNNNSSSSSEQKPMSATEHQVAMLNQRAKIERLQKKLEDNLVNLGTLKQSAYEGSSAKVSGTGTGTGTGAGTGGGGGGGVREEQEKARVMENRKGVHTTLENRFASGEPNADAQRLAEHEQARLAKHGIGL